MRKFIFPTYITFAKKMVKELSPYIDKNSKVLDLGCGRGLLGFFINKMLGAKVIGIDIRDDRKVDIPFRLYNGKKIPFPDNYFDVILIAYVLHHTSEIETLLVEIKRVSKGKIVIYEDTPENLIDRVCCWFHGRAFNSLFKISSDCCFLSKAEWLSLFNKYQLKPVQIKNISIFNPMVLQMYITKRTLFVLKR